uniref:Uncharacterized protein n=1 Tax=Rhizophora mucronata TaxID=61149 RepID=A0A2P2JML5_RHIMU
MEGFDGKVGFRICCSQSLRKESGVVTSMELQLQSFVFADRIPAWFSLSSLERSATTHCFLVELMDLVA